MATTKEQLTNALQRLAIGRDDSEAWAILFAASWATALGAAHRVLRGQLDLAQDVAQEAFRRVVRYCDFENIRDADAFLAYLAAVSRNAGRDAARKLAPQASEMSVEETDTYTPLRGRPSTPEELLNTKQLRQDLLAQLNPEDKALLELLLDGYSLREMASTLGLSYDNAGVRLHRMRKILRNHLMHKGL